MEKSPDTKNDQNKPSAFKRTVLITLSILILATIIYFLVTFLHHPAHSPFAGKFFGNGGYGYGVDDDLDAFGISMIVLAVIVGLLITYCCCGWLGCITTPCS